MIRVGYKPSRPHSFFWWSYDVAWGRLQRDNHLHWLAGEPLHTTLEPEHRQQPGSPKP